MDIARVKEAIDTIDKGIGMFTGGPLRYYLECLLKAHDMVINEYAPFKVGDRVELNKTLDIDEKSGWYGSRHFLVEGSKATVAEVEIDKQGLCFAVIFDDESYISTSGPTKGKIVPISSKHTYSFRVGKLRHVQGETTDMFTE